MHRSRLLDSLDWPTLAATGVLVAIGIFSIASATAGNWQAGIWRSQVVYLGLALVAATVIVLIDYRVWAEISLLLHGVVMLALVAVLFIGHEVGGNRSWLAIGSIRLGQPSEMAKLTTCLVLAVYLARRVRGTLGLRQLIEMGVLAGAPVALISIQPDMGTAVTFVPIVLAALIIGGVRWKWILVALLIALLLIPVAWPELKDYQKERILSVFDPDRDPSGVGYQSRQSRIAIGSGGITGKGLFKGTQNQLNFLPAQHTDFVMAVFAEEFGFAGVLTILGLFYYVFRRGMAAARSAQDRLGTYLCLLIGAWLAGQMAINVGVVLGRFPTIGVPLPFVSYGGSALIAAVCGIGLIVNVRSRRFVN
ncbi:MAG: rod shape-determining protein RodA [Acidobacteria bacterium]|nr:rod shape-determining protein RodA [Acidobacteriota bacterium]NIM64171.1 rod shape-determining protein RodA [Acidobacteriota bacterium]NIO60993.1 rod shape-determining protein RodA [Acidobacteriota bacterium]NIQ32006.1 rod shape-determining protein RodA [Acidobacteriota bacterium]NIQ87502.1 rod shape-determining protein RodA [Acidobacteriota bacterium]